MNIVDTTRAIAKPSIFIVAPSGSIKRLMRGSMWLFCSAQRIVVGSVAALKLQLIATILEEEKTKETKHFFAFEDVEKYKVKSVVNRLGTKKRVILLDEKVF